MPKEQQKDDPAPLTAGRKLASKFNIVSVLRELKDQKQRDMYKKILLIAGPAIVELFLTSLFNMVDLLMVGNLDKEAPGSISSVGLTNSPFFLMISFFAAVNVGTTTLVAWNVGAGKPKEASTILRQSLMVNMLLGTMLAMIGILASNSVMRFLSEDPSVIERATEYLQISCAGLPFLAMTLTITGALRGAGQTKIPMMYNLGANFTNVFMNYVLIYGHLGLPRMGVSGAALATTISRVMACTAAMLFIMRNKTTPVKLKLRESWKPRFDIIHMLFKIGLPSSAEQLAIQSGLLLYSKIVAGLGTSTTDAHHMVASVNNLAFSVSQAFSVTTTALVGQATGANDYQLAERYTRLTRRVARLLTGVLAVLLIVFSRFICGIYTDVAEVIEIALPVFYLMALVQYVQSSQMSTAGALRGSGDTMYPFYASLLGIWLFRLPLAAFFVYVCGYGLVGAWLSFFFDQCLRSFIIKRRFSKGTWKEMKARKEQKRKKLLQT